MRIALFQPNIPQNTGNIIRLAACLDVAVDIIKPTGFFLDDKKFRRSAMDYLKYAKIKEHRDWDSFFKWSAKNRYRIVLFTTKGKKDYLDHRYQQNDILLFGRESAGVPEKVHKNAKVRLIIPIQKKLRSLNVSSSVAIALSEGMRQSKR